MKDVSSKELDNSKYFYAVGRRKTSVVTVRLYNSPGKSLINDLDVFKIYTKDYEYKKFLKPFELLGLDYKNFHFTVKAKGGGKMSQLDAMVLGISRALVKFDESFKKPLKDAKLLTRDSREVERKKTGKKKSRRSEQYSKR
ncbi:MAG: 30S ribosomal protein S9 [Candidatus Dojkabacteria bacterium]|nr:30S ribosomal protein S9 [Candidatus Dojkabacteria bacterium]